MKEINSLVAYQVRTQKHMKKVLEIAYNVHDELMWQILTQSLLEMNKIIVTLIDLSFDGRNYLLLTAKPKELAREEVGDNIITLDL